MEDKGVLFAGSYMKGAMHAWQLYGYQVYTVQKELTKEISQTNLEILQDEIRNHRIQVVFSFDFLGGIAEACYQLKLPYVSWVWDSPHTHLWHKAARYSTNFLFLFDYDQYQTQLSRGMNNVWYLPLSADIDGFQEVIQKDANQQREVYGADVAFVGNIYNDQNHGLYDQILYMPDYLRGYLEALMDAQRKIWGMNLLEQGMDSAIWTELKKYVKLDVGDQYENGVYETMMMDVINKKIAQLERKEMCTMLAERFHFVLYSGADTSFNPKIVNRGYAIYNTQMPLIFSYSKINIHITVRSITSGIPLRVMDVLACGGFLLTNYQPEILEYFEDGKELVIYQDFEDMCEKITYYLEHEEERKAIALAGYRRVKELFHYNNQVGKIVEILEGQN